MPRREGWNYTTPKLFMSNQSSSITEESFATHDRSKFEKAIAGALKQTIDAHGMIVAATVSSAAKRIAGTAKQWRQAEVQALTTCRDHWKTSFEHERENVIRLRKMLYKFHVYDCICEDCQLVRSRANPQPPHE